MWQEIDMQEGPRAAPREAKSSQERSRTIRRSVFNSFQIGSWDLEPRSRREHACCRSLTTILNKPFFGCARLRQSKYYALRTTVRSTCYYALRATYYCLVGFWVAPRACFWVAPPACANCNCAYCTVRTALRVRRRIALVTFLGAPPACANCNCASCIVRTALRVRRRIALVAFWVCPLHVQIVLHYVSGEGRPCSHFPGKLPKHSCNIVPRAYGQWNIPGQIS